MRKKEDGMGKLEDLEVAPEKEYIGPPVFHDKPGEQAWDDIEERRLCMGPHYGQQRNHTIVESEASEELEVVEEKEKN